MFAVAVCAERLRINTHVSAVFTMCVCVCSPVLTVLLCVLFRLRCMHILFRDLNIAKIEKVSYLRIVDYLRKHKKIYFIYICYYFLF